MICRDTPTHWWVWVCGWLGGSVGQWVGSGQITKNLINLELIERFMICRDTPTHTPTHGWVCGWLGGSVGQMVGQVK